MYIRLYTYIYIDVYDCCLYISNDFYIMYYIYIYIYIYTHCSHVIVVT